MPSWKQLKQKVVYKNKWVTVYEDDVINPVGEETVYVTYMTTLAGSTLLLLMGLTAYLRLDAFQRVRLWI